MSVIEAIIPAANWPALKKKLQKMQKRAIKLGLPPVSYEKNDSNYVPLPGDEFGGQVQVVHIKITGEAPVLAGWRFVAKIDFQVGGPLILSLPGEPDIPPEFREAGASRCDHCNTRRHRKASYVVQNEEGEYQLVGSTCVKDFLGGLTPTKLLRYAEDLYGLEGLVGGAGGMPLEPDVYSLRYFLACTARAIQLDGWVSRTRAADEDLVATADQVWSRLWERDWGVYEPFGADWELADNAIAWFEAMGGKTVGELNEYQHNLVSIALSGVVWQRTIGYAASMVGAYLRDTASEPSDFPEEGGHVGEVKERRIWHARLVRTRQIRNAWGGSLLHEFRLVSGGNILIWWASMDAASNTDLSIDETVEFKATVKEHTTYQGQAQTTVTRLSLI